MTARSGIPLGSGIWTMMPATRESAWRPAERRADVGLAGIRRAARPGDPRWPTRRQPSRILWRYTADGASLPTTTTARAGVYPHSPRNATTSAATRSRIALAMGPPAGVAGRPRQDHLRPAGRAADRGPRGCVPSRASVGETLDLVGQCLRALVEVTGRGLVAQRWEVDVHIRGGRTAGRHGHQAGNLEVRCGIRVAAPGERLRETYDIEARLHRAQRRHGRRVGGLADRRAPGRLLLISLARQLHRRAVARVGVASSSARARNRSASSRAAGPVSACRSACAP